MPLPTAAGAPEHAPAVRDAPHVGAEEQIGREPDVGEEQEREEPQVRAVRVVLLKEDRERGNDDVHAQDPVDVAPHLIPQGTKLSPDLLREREAPLDPSDRGLPQGREIAPADERRQQKERTADEGPEGDAHGDRLSPPRPAGRPTSRRAPGSRA